MFTGLITDIGTIIATEPRGDLRVTIACAYPTAELAIGESIACSGACMTVVAIHPQPEGAHFTIELSAESVFRTATAWHPGTRLNLERSLALGDKMGGHLVTGHVDSIASIRAIAPIGDSHCVELEAPSDLARFIAAKGSVTLDGVSLTVNAVEGSRFEVNIISHTWQHTTLGDRKAGDTVNLEIDLIARYVARLLQPSAS